MSPEAPQFTQALCLLPPSAQEATKVLRALARLGQDTPQTVELHPARAWGRRAGGCRKGQAALPSCRLRGPFWAGAGQRIRASLGRRRWGSKLTRR